MAHPQAVAVKTMKNVQAIFDRLEIVASFDARLARIEHALGIDLSGAPVDPADAPAPHTPEPETEPTPEAEAPAEPAPEPSSSGGESVSAEGATAPSAVAAPANNRTNPRRR